MKLWRWFQTPGAHRCPRDSHALFGQFLAQFCQITSTCSNSAFGAILVATSLLNINKVLSKSYKNWPSYEQNTVCPYLGIRNKYYGFWPINLANINILNETNFI